MTPPPTRLRTGSLFSGYGGLEMAVNTHYRASTAWVSDIDKGACKILAHRYPGVPNLGDIAAVDWPQVEPVDILTGGSPCQDLSHAGRRAGMTEGTRSNLWVAMREAIAQLRPTYVVWENVRGAYSAAADSAVEPCPGCVGDGSGVHLRALGRVLGDLSDLGYDCRWHGLRAADVGAPHGRFRVFVVATDAQCQGRRAQGHAAPGHPAGRRASAVTGRPGGVASLFPTPSATDGTKGGPGQRGSSGDLMLPSAVAMLPTPQARDFKGYGPADGERHDPNLSAIPLLLPKPSVADVMGGRKARSGDRNDEPLLNGIAADDRWGDYAHAIATWAGIRRRLAPDPTQTSTRGNPQLSAAFVEWMMGLPAGWVTDVPGITRNEALKALGNGVVPQQAAEALRVMDSWAVAA